MWENIVYNGGGEKDLLKYNMEATYKGENWYIWLHKYFQSWFAPSQNINKVERIRLCDDV